MIHSFLGSHRLQSGLIFLLMLLTTAQVRAQLRNPSASARSGVAGLQTIENSQIRVGINTNYGGAITYLAFKDTRGGKVSTDNMVNNFDLGRQVQISMYSGPEDYSRSNPYWPNLGWNPIQAGDFFHNPSEVVAITNDGSQLYAKTIPKQWALNNVPGEASIEHWIRLEGNVVKVHAKVVLTRSDKTQYPGGQQEFPCFYVNADYHNIMYYNKKAPYTNDELLTTRLVPPQQAFYGNVLPTEPWVASVNDNQYGVGLFTQGNYEWVAGYFGPEMSGNEFSSAAGYMSSSNHVLLDNNITYEWDYQLVLGSISEIRSYVYSQPRIPSGPSFLFDNSRKGWYYENAKDSGWPISGKLHVMLDNATSARVMSPYVFWKGSEVPKIYVRAAFNTKSSSFLMNWRRSEDVTLYGTGDRLTQFPIVNDGQFHTYTLDLSQRSDWLNTTIGQIVFKPVSEQDQAGSWMELAWVSTNPSGPSGTPTTPQAPVASAIPNQSTPVGQAYQLELSQYFRDPDYQPLTYSATGLPAGLSLSGSVLSGTPSVTGVSSISVKVTDPDNLTAASSYQLTIQATSRTPQAPIASAIANQTATVGTAFQLDLSKYFTDPDSQVLTYSATGLPAGLALSGSVLSGTLSGTGVSMITVKATDTDNQSASTSFQLTVNPATTTPPTNPSSLSITGVNMVSCTVADPSNSKRYNLRFTPQYAGQSSSPITFSVVNELSPTTQPGPYSLSLWGDRPSVTLVAKQPESGLVQYNYNWLAACNSTTPRQPPVASSIPSQTATVGQTYQLALSPYFSDPGGQPLTYAASGLPAGLSLNGSVLSGTPSATGVSSVSVSATNTDKLSVSSTFRLSVSPAASQPTGFTIVGARVVDCQVTSSINSKQYQVSIQPQYAGQDNSQQIAFSVVNELGSTTQPGPYTLYLWGDSQQITLVAKQPRSAEARYVYRWQADCPAAKARKAADVNATDETTAIGGLQIRLLGNPVTNGQLRVAIQGVAGQPVELRLLDQSGRLLTRMDIEQAAEVEQRSLVVSPAWGSQLLLQVSSGAQQQSLKVIHGR